VRFLGHRRRLTRLSPKVAGTRQTRDTASRIEVIDMPWWETILFLIAVGLAIWGFLSWAGLTKRMMSGKTSRTAESMYDDYADSPKKQRQYAREHGGSWRNES
jgi:hypothetical protein